MRQTAKVVALHGERAQVEVIRRSACGGECGSCHGCDGLEDRPVSVWASNDIDAKLGDRVTVESRSAALLGTAFVVYLLPFLFLFFGYFFAANQGLSEGYSIAAGGVGFAVALLLVQLLNHRQQKFQRLQFFLVDDDKQGTA
jgi:Positive regulator of sigma E activity